MEVPREVTQILSQNHQCDLCVTLRCVDGEAWNGRSGRRKGYDGEWKEDDEMSDDETKWGRREEGMNKTSKRSKWSTHRIT
jgi:hypothetical protein